MPGRPFQLDKVDEAKSSTIASARRDYRLSSRFLARVRRCLRTDDQTAKNIAALMLRAMNGWTPQMIGLVFGRGPKSAAVMVRDGQQALPRSIRDHFDYRTDTFAAIQTSDAETLLDRLGKVRQLLGNDPAIDAAICNLSDALLDRVGE